MRPVFVLTYNTYTKKTNECLFIMGLDEAKAKAALNAVADRIIYPPFSPYKVAVSIPNNDTPVSLAP